MKILVHDKEDFDLVIKTSKELHDNRDLDFENPLIAILTHMYRINSEDATQEEISAIKNLITIDKSVRKISI